MIVNQYTRTLLFRVFCRETIQQYSRISSSTWRIDSKKHWIPTIIGCTFVGRSVKTWYRVNSSCTQKKLDVQLKEAGCDKDDFSICLPLIDTITPNVFLSLKTMGKTPGHFPPSLYLCLAFFWNFCSSGYILILLNWTKWFAEKEIYVCPAMQSFIVDWSGERRPLLSEALTFST